MDLHEKAVDLYSRKHKSSRLHMKLTIASGIMTSDLPESTETATETQDGITTELGETLGNAADDATGITHVAIRQDKAGDTEKVYSVEMVSAAAAFGTVTPTATISANGNILIELDSDQDITGDDGDMELVIEYRRS